MQLLVSVKDTALSHTQGGSILQERPWFQEQTGQNSGDPGLDGQQDLQSHALNILHQLRLENQVP